MRYGPESARKRGYTWQWEKARAAFLAEHPLCRRCGDAGVTTAATVVDHVTPHAGDTGLFWDRSNWQPLCRRCHDVKTATEDGGFGRIAYSALPRWLTPATCELHIVCGPPGSGKSTHAADAARAGRGDVIDLDAIVSQLARQPIYQCTDQRVLALAMRERNDRLGRLSQLPASRAVWFIVSAAGAQHRQWWRATLRPKTLTLIPATFEQCIQRIKADPRRAGFEDAHIAAARQWFEREAQDRPMHSSACGVDGLPTDPAHPWNLGAAAAD